MLMVCLAKKLRGCKEQIMFLPLKPTNKENAPVSYMLIIKQRTQIPQTIIFLLTIMQ